MGAPAEKQESAWHFKFATAEATAEVVPAHVLWVKDCKGPRNQEGLRQVPESQGNVAEAADGNLESCKVK